MTAGDGHPSGALSEPVLPGTAPSDYERYLRTDELLALQKTPQEQAHRDELLFQCVHQSSEILLKLAHGETAAAAAAADADELDAAVRLLRRAAHAVALVTDALHLLEHMSPWEYMEVRRVLGHGSGFDSPGFRRLRDEAARLRVSYDACLARHGVDVVAVYLRGRELERLYQLSEALIELDERVTIWRMVHVKMVERVIGGGVIGTQGTPVEVLVGLTRRVLFPELWAARNELTERAFPVQGSAPRT
jgi:tryptophan 2,3-dioxygenase